MPRRRRPGFRRELAALGLNTDVRLALNHSEIYQTRTVTLELLVLRNYWLTNVEMRMATFYMPVTFFRRLVF